MSGVVIATTRVGANTSVGTQNITTSDLDGKTPKAAIVVVTKATANGTAVDDAVLSYGVASGTSNRWVKGIRALHNSDQASDIPRSFISDSDLVYLIDPNSTSNIGIADIDSFITNGIRLDWTSAPSSAFLISVLFIAGDNVSAHANSVNLGNSTDNEVVVTAPGFEPDLLFTMSGLENTGSILSSLGTVHNGSFITQQSIGFRLHNISVSDHLLMIRNDAGLFGTNAAGNLSWRGDFTSFNSTGFTLFTRNAGASNTNMRYLALKLDNTSSWLGAHTTPTTTGNYSETGPGFIPQAVIQLMTFTEAFAASSTDKYTDNRAGSLGFSFITDTNEYSNSIASQDNVATTNSQSLSEDKAVQITDHDGAAGVTGSLVSLDSVGWTTNYTNVTGTGKLFLSIAIGHASEGGPSFPITEEGMIYRA